MFKRFLLPAALLLCASACDTQSAAPEFAELPASLALSLPAFRQLVETQSRSVDHTPTIASPAMIASMQINGEELPSDFEQVVMSGLIATPSQADVGFLDDAHLAFGQALGTSRGSYYRNQVDLKLTMGGSTIATNSGHESETCNCAHPFNPWGKTANTTIPVNGLCGHGASANAGHDARLDWSGFDGKVTNLLAASSSDTDHADQPSCPTGVPGGGSGGGNGGLDGEEWYICYWVDYYNSQGQFTHRQNLGCEPLNVS